jgi:hypothetical protein
MIGVFAHEIHAELLPEFAPLADNWAVTRQPVSHAAKAIAGRSAHTPLTSSKAAPWSCLSVSAGSPSGNLYLTHSSQGAARARVEVTNAGLGE